MNVFEMFRTWAEEPVTVLAETLEESLRIYAEWIDKHHPDRSDEPSMVYPFTGARLKARPRRAALANRSSPGIAYWNKTANCWTVSPPSGATVADLVEPEPLVSFFQLDADEESDMMIFADSFEGASSIFCAYQLARWGQLPTRFSLTKKSRWDLHGEFATLRDDMEADISGVGRRDYESKWRILPPDHEWE